MLLCEYNKPNKSINHTGTFVYFLLFEKMEFYVFYLGQAKTVAAGLLLLALLPILDLFSFFSKNTMA